MKNIFTKLIQLLFPASRAFYFFIDSNLNKMVSAISVFIEYSSSFFQKIYFDFFPQSTRAVTLWEEAFGVDLGVLNTETERKLLNVFWKKNHGTTEFMQSVLRMIVSDICVTENIPLHNPSDCLVTYFTVCGNDGMCCGVETAICGYRVGFDKGVEEHKSICGTENMCCGNETAICGFRELTSGYQETLLENDVSGIAGIPYDKFFWESCFFISGEIERSNHGVILFINFILVQKKYKQIIELLILRIKPAHTRAVIFIKYT